jgi:hypothetical protein
MRILKPESMSRRVSPLAGFQVTIIGRFWVTTEAFLGEPTRDSEFFGRNRQTQCFSTSCGRVIACQIRKLSPIQGEISQRKCDPREMLSARQLFQNVG